MSKCKNCIFSLTNNGTCQRKVDEGQMCWQYEPVISSYEDMRREEPALVSLELVASKFRPEDYQEIIKPILLRLVGYMAKSAPKEMQSSKSWDMACNRMQEILEIQQHDHESVLIN